MRLILHRRTTGDVGVVVLALAIASALSILTSKFEIWEIYVITSIVLILGVGFFPWHSTVEKNHMKFYDFLPIRRSQIWLCNFLEATLVLILLSSTLTWHQLFILDLENNLYFSRWDIFVGPFALGFWSASVVALVYSTLHRMANIVVVGFTTSLMAVLLLWAGIIYVLPRLGALPSFTELAQVLIFSSLLFYSAGYFIFTRSPHKIRSHAASIRWGAGLFLVCSAIMAGYFLYECYRWVQPDYGKRYARVMRLGPSEEANYLVGGFNSIHSGTHWYAIALNSGLVKHIGRDFDLVADWGEKNFGYLSSRDEKGMWPSEEQFVTMDLEQGSETRLNTTEKRELANGDQIYIERSEFEWAGDGQYLTYLEDEYIQNDSTDEFPELKQSFIVIRDAELNELHRVECYPTRGISVSDSGFVLGLAPVDDNSDEMADSYLRVHMQSGDVEEFSLPGEAICFAKDLSRVACIKRRVEGETIYRSYVLVEFPSLRETVVIGEDDLAPSVIDDSRMTSAPLRVETVHYNFGGLSWNFPSGSLADICFSPNLNKAVWIKKYIKDQHITFTVVYLDLVSKSRNIIIPSSQMPKIPVLVEETMASTIPFRVLGFTPDGNAFLYQFHDKVFVVNTSDLEAQMIADLGNRQKHKNADTDDYYEEYYLFSPDRLKLLRAVLTAQEGRDAESHARTILECFESGDSRVITDVDGFVFDTVWVADDQIAFVEVEDQEIYVVNVKGSDPKRVFPPAEVVAEND